MKKWLTQQFLPMWAKQTVLAENRELRDKIAQLQEENRVLKAYIRGLLAGARAVKRNALTEGGKA
jgi:hypothetical protein